MAGGAALAFPSSFEIPAYEATNECLLSFFFLAAWSSLA